MVYYPVPAEDSAILSYDTVDTPPNSQVRLQPVSYFRRRVVANSMPCIHVLIRTALGKRERTVVTRASVSVWKLLCDLSTTDQSEKKHPQAQQSAIPSQVLLDARVILTAQCSVGWGLSVSPPG
jgi:hypothetical protein